MLFKTRLLACAATLVLAFSAPAMADLVGTSVTGSMNIAGDSNNYFDPANGQVPDWAQNATLGTTMPIDATLYEFGFQNDTHIAVADFIGDGLTFIDLSSEGSPADITYTFTNSAFAGLSLVETINNFDSGFNASLVGDVITLYVPGFESGDTRYAMYSLTSSNGSSDGGSNDDGQTSCTPEPASLLLFGSGLAGCALLARRKLVAA